MKTRKEAKKLAASMTKVGKLMDVKVSHLLSPMDEPVGSSVGNALEVAKCAEILQGGGPSDVVDLVLDLAEQVSKAPRAKVARWLSDARADCWDRPVHHLRRDAIELGRAEARPSGHGIDVAEESAGSNGIG